MTRSWGDLSVLRYPDQIIHMKSVPQKDQRLQVAEAFLYKPVHDLKEYVQGCTTELVFNLDEVDISDWEDRKTRTIVAVPTRAGHMIYHEISRNAKRISVIICVSTSGKSLIPSISTLYDFSSVRESLKKHFPRSERMWP
jgi:hypothetical protein